MMKQKVLLYMSKFQLILVSTAILYLDFFYISIAMYRCRCSGSPQRFSSRPCSLPRLVATHVFLLKGIIAMAINW